MKKAAGTYLLDTLTATSYGKFMVRALAGNAEETVADTFYYHVRKPVEIAELPTGIRDGINYTGPGTTVLSLVQSLADRNQFFTIFCIPYFNDPIVVN